MRQNNYNNNKNNNNNNNRQRSRGRRQGGGGGGGNPSNKVYDSNGPDVRVRGSAQTVADKYLQLATDATSSGDSIKAEGYFQFAEHYLRIVATNVAVRAQKQAEKDKAAEEQAARREEKRAADAARDATRDAAREASRAETAKADEPKTAPVSDNEPSESANDTDPNWEGPQPAFLKRDDEPAAEKKPKRARRKPVAKKPKEDAGDEPEAQETAAE